MRGCCPGCWVHVRVVATVLLGVLPWALLAESTELRSDSRPETEWFSQAGRGVFTHFLADLQNEFGPNSQGTNSSWDQCVQQFDVEAYAADAAATGAKYAVFTLMQVSKFMCAPNAVYDSITGYRPGDACARRDLVMDLWAALDKRGLKLLLYWTGDGPRGDPQVRSPKLTVAFSQSSYILITYRVVGARLRLACTAVTVTVHTSG